MLYIHITVYCYIFIGRHLYSYFDKWYKKFKEVLLYLFLYNLDPKYNSAVIFMLGYERIKGTISCLKQFSLTIFIELEGIYTKMHLFDFKNLFYYKDNSTPMLDILFKIFKTSLGG